MELHFCRDCSRHLPASAFSSNVRRPNGLSFYCRECLSARQRAGYEARRKAAGAEPRPTGQREKHAPGFKRCPRCTAVLPLDAFGRNRSSRDGYTTYCRLCHNETTAETLARNGGSRRYHLARRYKITLEEYDAMHDAQGGKCAVCRERKAAHVDHDHRTGKVRGLLCFTCNAALGNVRDDPGLLMALIGYLAAHGVAPVTTLTANTRRLPGVAGAFRDEIGPGVWRLRVAA
jgi:hypothetical protein